jgi:hypothetical protein
MAQEVQGQQPLPSSGQSKASGFHLEDGTPIKLRLQRTVSSADAQVNEQIDFDVLEEIRVNDVTVIPKGSVAWGTVTEAQSKRRMGRGGKLNVNIDAVRLADGQKAALRSVKEAKGGGHVGAMAGAMVATAIFVPVAAPVFLLMHGKDITIPKGTEITAYINGDFTLDLARFQGTPASEPVMAGAARTGASTPGPEDSVVVVKSTPDGADITVDGKFVGSTPSTLRLSYGDHTISVERSGFQSWRRTMTLGSGESVTVDAALGRVE